MTNPTFAYCSVAQHNPPKFITSVTSLAFIEAVPTPTAMAPDNISMEDMAKHPRCTAEGFLSPPYLDVPLSFVYQKDRSDVHIFLNDLSHPQYLCYVADNFRHVDL